jgi:uncharacterized SAM-binding protein YcdF (DUF218 family)
MLFFLRKLAEAVSLPVGLAIVLVVAGVLLRRRLLALLAAALLCVTGTGVVAKLLTLPLERAFSARAAATCPHADAIVALSGSIVHGINSAGVQWGESAGRYLEALALAKAGKADRLVFTGASLSDGSGMTEGGVLRKAAIEEGIDPARVLVTGPVWTTADEAKAVSGLNGVHTVLLVTSAFHMRRAVMLFRDRGLQVTPVPTAQKFPGTSETPAIAWLPTASGLRDSDEALREYYGLAAYRLLLPLRRLTRSN